MYNDLFFLVATLLLIPSIECELNSLVSFKGQSEEMEILVLGFKSFRSVLDILSNCFLWEKAAAMS